MMSMTRPCDIPVASQLSPTIIKRLSILKDCKILENAYFLFKALYLFKIREQTPFFEQKVWLFGKCSLNL